MKKKLLSVLMAGALVATSSVNAFAQGKVVTGEEGKTLETDVTITGNVANEQDQIKPGTLSVTVPTAANFTVSQNGTFSGATIEVRNGGDQPVDIYAYEFFDTNNDSGINVVKPSELQNKNRTHLTLKLAGNRGTAYFTSARENESRGVYGDEAYSVKGDATGIKVSRIAEGETDSLRLEGEAGKGNDPVNNPEKDNFTLKLKIAKSTDK